MSYCFIFASIKFFTEFLNETEGLPLPAVLKGNCVRITSCPATVSNENFLHTYVHCSGKNRNGKDGQKCYQPGDLPLPK